MRPIPPRAALLPTALALLLGAADGARAGDAHRAGTPSCERGKAIERDLGQRGYRVVVAGGYRIHDDRPVKVQIWENRQRDWVITEAFIGLDRTCIVRSGRRLHTLH